mmetsp:Transcript_13800/g.28504  ORF Transcript_13800/g.28504 Transcript_13800/m.28504 type:complete len:87 (-) Transcript_13800:43-303(-)
MYKFGLVIKKGQRSHTMILNNCPTSRLKNFSITKNLASSKKREEHHFTFRNHNGSSYPSNSIQSKERGGNSEWGWLFNGMSLSSLL